MSENDFFDDRKVSERGSGCLLPFIVLFALGFMGCISDLRKEGALGGAIFSLFLAAFLLTKYLFPSSARKVQKPSNYLNSSYNDDDEDPYTSDDMDDIFNEWENGDI